MNNVFEERLMQFDSAEVNHLYEEEVRILDLIRNGETRTLEKLLSLETLAFPFLTQDEMKNHEYMLVSATAVICRASIAAGTPVSVCILTSDRFLRKISALRTETEARALLREIVLTYAKMNREAISAGGTNAVVGRAKRYIRDHLFEPLSLSAVAGGVGVSPEHLSRCFQQETHKTVNEAIRESKIDAAKTILGTTNREVREIAELLGFSSAAYFCKVFKAVVGQTPTAYRNAGGKR